MTNEEIVKEYQCSGCVNGPYEDCFKKEPELSRGIGCEKHCAGTSATSPRGIERFFLGLPKGFCRIGADKDLKIQIFKTQNDLDKVWKYDIFNIPTWKYKNSFGHTIVKGLMPRISKIFIHVIIKCDFDNIKCLEITNKDIEEMD